VNFDEACSSFVEALKTNELDGNLKMVIDDP